MKHDWDIVVFMIAAWLNGIAIGVLVMLEWAR